MVSLRTHTLYSRQQNRWNSSCRKSSLSLLGQLPVVALKLFWVTLTDCQCFWDDTPTVSARWNATKLSSVDVRIASKTQDCGLSCKIMLYCGRAKRPRQRSHNMWSSPCTMRVAVSFTDIPYEFVATTTCWHVKVECDSLRILTLFWEDFRIPYTFLICAKSKSRGHLKFKFNITRDLMTIFTWKMTIKYNIEQWTECDKIKVRTLPQAVKMAYHSDRASSHFCVEDMM